MHEKMRGTVLFLIINIFYLVPTLEAQRNRDVEVYYEKSRTKRGEYQFYCNNKTNLRYTVNIKLELINMRVTGSNPWKGDVKPGKNRLFSIKPINESSTYNFSYSYTSIVGCKKPKPKKDIRYTLPINEGEEIRTVTINYVGDRFGYDPPEGYYAIGFKMEKGDTILAMRKGVVMEVKSNALTSKTSDLTFVDNSNYILVQHQDCTVGSYRDVSGNILAKKGDVIIPGQPIAFVGNNDFTSGAHFKFSTYYYKPNPKKKDGKETDEEFSWTYFSPVFVADESEIVLEGNRVYKSVWDKKKMTKELSKGEKKKWELLSGKK